MSPEAAATFGAAFGVMMALIRVVERLVDAAIARRNGRREATDKHRIPANLALTLSPQDREWMANRFDLQRMAYQRELGEVLGPIAENQRRTVEALERFEARVDRILDIGKITGSTKRKQS